MAGTRQSARNASQGNSSPPAATPANGTKRKADDASPSSNKKKQQKTLEEVIPDEAKREEVKAALANEAGDEMAEDKVEDKTETEDAIGGAGRLIEDYWCDRLMANGCFQLRLQRPKVMAPMVTRRMARKSRSPMLSIRYRRMKTMRERLVLRLACMT